MERPAQILRRYQLRPKASWGQNFLGDEDALRRIVRALAPLPQEAVVELGAGLGHLTSVLLESGAQVTAVERDRELARILKERFPLLRVEEADAKEIDFARVASAEKVAVVGNLPYHLTSPILFRLLEQRAKVSRAVFTLQKEVVERLAAQPGGRDYGVPSVLLGMYFRLEELFTLPASLFYPPPKVDSAVARLTTLDHPRAEVTSDQRFRQVVKAAFAQRRKTILNSLRSDRSLGRPEELRLALEKAGIDLGCRAETLSVEQFAALERSLALG